MADIDVMDNVMYFLSSIASSYILCGIKGGVAGPDAPKIQALPEWGGGGLTLAWIFVKDLSTCTEGPQR